MQLSYNARLYKSLAMTQDGQMKSYKTAEGRNSIGKNITVEHFTIVFYLLFVCIVLQGLAFLFEIRVRLKTKFAHMRSMV